MAQFAPQGRREFNTEGHGQVPRAELPINRERDRKIQGCEAGKSPFGVTPPSLSVASAPPRPPWSDALPLRSLRRWARHQRLRAGASKRGPRARSARAKASRRRGQPLRGRVRGRGGGEEGPEREGSGQRASEVLSSGLLISPNQPDCHEMDSRHN